MPTKFTAKVGGKSVNPSSKGSSPTKVVAGGPGKTFPQMPFASNGKGKGIAPMMGKKK